MYILLTLLPLVLLYPVTRSHISTVIDNPKGSQFKGREKDGGFYRSILVDNANENVYIGARNYVYKFNLNDLTEKRHVTLVTNRRSRPNFGVEETTVGTDKDKSSDVYKLINKDLKQKKPIQLIATEKLSQVYKLQNHTFEEQCRRQIKILKLYYGKHLQLPLDNPDVVCTRHSRGLSWIGSDKLFTIKNGLLGTMPVAPTGVSDYDKGYPVWYNLSAQLTLDDPDEVEMIVGPSRKSESLFKKVADAGRTCHSCRYSKRFEDCKVNFTTSGDWCYREYPIPNYMSTNYLCDYTPAPTYSILNINSLAYIRDGPVRPTSKESCAGGNLASTLLSGYHPDQVTKSLTSASGNGETGGSAIYVLAEIGQEKQLDVNHEAFMGFEEPMPLTSSASLALVRLMITNQGDVDYESIVTSNPFKETWVTSPLTKFGRVVKSGNQATVPHRPRAVALFEDDKFIYIFFREVEWESMQHPEYTVNRYHYLWKSYDRTVSYPWEEPRDDPLIKQLEKSDPAMYAMLASYSSINYKKLNITTNEHVYAPRLDAFKQTWDNSKLISRVARVCKNDLGLPMGVQDASIFNLDHKLSLSAFQTFLKSKLTCTVKVKAIPRSWRLRQDEFSFFYENYWNFQNGFNPCTVNDGCIESSCGYSYLDYTSNTNTYDGPFCDRSKRGKDLSFRAFVDYTPRNLYYINKKGLFQTTISGWSQYHWSYTKTFPTFTSVSFEYTELKDIYKIGSSVYGVFGSPFSESSEEGLPVPSATAICQFTMDDIKAAFDGPFKKRINNAWRPVGFDRSKPSPIRPDPYSCQADPVRNEAVKIEKMDIDFTDETLPLEDELRNFDMREKSERLNFFEKDVEGSRTMWHAVQADPVYTSKDYHYDRIVAEQINDVSVLYVTTNKGEVHKFAVWSVKKRCWKPNPAELEKWWQEKTNLKNNSWGINYFDLTQESKSSGAADRIFESEWDCTPSTQHKLISIYKPFGSVATKIWDIKLAENQLILGTDKMVRTVSTAQCTSYKHCGGCSQDPHCGWSNKERKCMKYKSGLVQGVKKRADCSACLEKKMKFDPGKNVWLDTTTHVDTDSLLSQLVWYHNNTMVSERLERHIFTRNNSLLILNARHEDVGTWEVRDAQDKTCIIKYHLNLSDCQTEECKFQKQLTDWCTAYDKWREEMEIWQYNMHASGCSNTDST